MLLLNKVDCADKKILEVGPKHGRHTVLVSSKGAKEITCVDLPHKKGMITRWQKSIKCKLSVHYEDFLRWQTDERFDVILFAGVIYHNTEQLRLLKKIRALCASEKTILYFESATTRTKDLQNRDVIEVHWPKPYRDTKTIRFLPSHSACLALLEMAGWEILEVDKSNPQRLQVICRASGTQYKSYPDVDHTHLEEDIDENGSVA